MSEREIRTITLKSGKQVSIKTYLTARERNELRGVFFGNFKIDAAGGKPEIKEIDGSVLGKAEEKLIDLAVVSFDGSTENVPQRLLDGSTADYDEVVAEAGKIEGGNFTPAK